MGENREVREVFLAAAACDTPEERNRYLDEACRGKPELRRRVDVLLRAHEQAGAFLEEPAAPLPGRTIALAAPLTEKPGDKIGPYKLLQQIGEGGCGVVYMAEQAEPIRRKVALKVIKVGMDTKQVIARFEAERQALALMDHPNIARVLNAGATETGRPYFVMELVRGQRITEYCDENSLDTEARLGLFMQVCHAIQHAHQKGIIHRDIKPSNILVTVVDGRPVPKVIDFGIAKAIGQQLTDKTLFTAFEQFIGTPAYMSPEQAALSGVDVDTRSDIYSLGVLLYELLTGHTPFDPKTLVAAGLDEMRRMIREAEPPKPSTRISTLEEAERTTVAKHRQAEPAALRRLVRGDLDWIVMKCLEKDRGRRYETANSVALDIEHHLQHQPVSAAAPSTVYRAQKFIRRHKAGLTVAAALVLLLAAGVVVSTWQAVRATRAESKEKVQRARAEQERGRAEQQRMVAEGNEKKAETGAARSAQVARFLKDTLQRAAPRAARGEDTKLLRGILDQTAERLGKELTNQPAVEAELRLVIGTTYLDIGFPAEAEAMTREALRLRRSVLGETNAALADYLRGLASVLIRQGGKVRDAEAEGLVRQALAIQQSLPAADDKVMADTLDYLGRACRGQGKLSEGEAWTRKALAMRIKLFGSNDVEVAGSLNQLCLVLSQEGKQDEAEAAVRDALAIMKQPQVKWHPDIVFAHSLLASVLKHKGKFAEADAAYRETLALVRSVNGEDSAYTEDYLSRYATFLRDQGRQAELEALLRESVELRRKVLGNEHPRVANSLQRLANALRDQRKLVEAESLFRQALAMRRKLLGEERLEVAESLIGLAQVLVNQGKLAEAEPLHRQALALRRKLAGNNPSQLADTLIEFALFIRNRGRLAEAEDLAREAVGIRKHLPDSENAALADALLIFGWTLSLEDKNPEAETSLRQGVALRKKLSGKDNSKVVGSLGFLARALLRAGKPDEATAVFRELAEIGSASALNDLAWQLATTPESKLRDGTNAVGLAEKAVAGTNRKKAMYLDTLAAAYAEAGQFEKAVAVQEEAMALLRDERSRKDYASRLKLYEANTPYRTPE